MEKLHNISQKSFNQPKVEKYFTRFFEDFINIQIIHLLVFHFTNKVIQHKVKFQMMKKLKSLRPIPNKKIQRYFKIKIIKQSSNLNPKKRC